jgi:hypothetical protein
VQVTSNEAVIEVVVQYVLRRTGQRRTDVFARPV